MPTRKPGESGYCKCADCKRDYAALAKRRGEGKPPRPDMDRFWENVHAFSELRDLDKRTRR